MAALAVTGAIHGGETVGLRAEDGVIAELGPDVAAKPGDELIDAAGKLLVPALINAHTHAAMTLFRGYGDDLPLMEWLEEKIWPVEAKLEFDDVYWGTRLACMEMIRTGTVGFWDMYWHPEATAQAVQDAGMRAVIGAPLIDAGPENTLREDAERSVEQLRAAGDGIEPALAPHAIYTVSEESLGWIAERAAAERLPVHIHLSETEPEVQGCIEQHGVRPAAFLDRLGLLGERTMLAHGVWLDDEELALVAERGATIASNPVANMKLAVGKVFPYPAARKAGAAVALGTDGPGSNNSLDLFSDMKTFALVQKHAAADAAAVDAQEVWELATGARAPLLGASGRLAAGERADFLLLDARDPSLSLGDLAAGLVYAAPGAVVDTTVSGGRVLMRGGEVEGAEEVVAKAIERAAGLGLRQ